jgi:hypothetical protein
MYQSKSKVGIQTILYIFKVHIGICVQNKCMGMPRLYSMWRYHVCRGIVAQLFPAAWAGGTGQCYVYLSMMCMETAA